MAGEGEPAAKIVREKEKLRLKEPAAKIVREKEKLRLTACARFGRGSPRQKSFGKKRNSDSKTSKTGNGGVLIRDSCVNQAQRRETPIHDFGGLWEAAWRRERLVFGRLAPSGIVSCAGPFPGSGLVVRSRPPCRAGAAWSARLGRICSGVSWNSWTCWSR